MTASSTVLPSDMFSGMFINQEKGNHRGFAPTLFENELHHIREYIINNPAKWELD